MNFYRTQYFDEQNRKLVEFSRAGDRQAILDHLEAQDRSHPDLFSDERFENRYGMQEIYTRIQARAARGDVLDVACGNAELLVRLQQRGYAVTGVDISPVRVEANHVRLFDGPTLWAVVDAIGLIVESVERIPYLLGEDPHNLFVTAHKAAS